MYDEGEINMIVMDLYSGIDELEYSSSSTFLESWKTYLNNNDIYSVCTQDTLDYDFERQCFPVITHALENKDIIAIAHDNFIECTSEIENKYYKLFGYDEVYVVFYLGLCNGAGWVLEINEYLIWCRENC